MRKALSLLGKLDDTDIEWIAQHGSKVRVLRGESLVRQGESLDSLFIIVDGKMSVRVRKTLETEVAVLLAGEIVGEISFVSSRPPGASVIATEDSQAIAIPRAVLNRKLSVDEAFAARFYRAVASFLAERLYVTTSRLGFGSSAQDERDAASEVMDDEMMEDVSLAASKFDHFVRLVSGPFSL